MHFEPIQKQVRGSVAKLRHPELPDIMAAHELDPHWSIETLRFRIDTDRTAFDVAGFINSQLIALSLATIVIDEFSLLNIVVAPSYRHQGIGHWLLSAQMNAAAQTGCKSFFLEVRPGNRNAINLYRKLGFHPDGIRTNYYQDPVEDALLMVKRP